EGLFIEAEIFDLGGDADHLRPFLTVLDSLAHRIFMRKELPRRGLIENGDAPGSGAIFGCKAATAQYAYSQITEKVMADGVNEDLGFFDIRLGRAAVNLHRRKHISAAEWRGGSQGNRFDARQRGDAIAQLAIKLRILLTRCH